jgi:hypothetical protein
VTPSDCGRSMIDADTTQVFDKFRVNKVLDAWRSI